MVKFMGISMRMILMDAINSGNTTAKEIAELVKSDAGLVAQVLKVVNSAYYGLPRHISDVTHAVAHSEAHPSSIVLPVLPDIEPPEALPACPSLRSQPCRDYVPHTNAVDTGLP